MKRVRTVHGVLATVMAVALPLLSAANSRAHDNHHPLLLGAIFPRLSPDGASVAFAHQGTIWRVPRGGGKMMRLTRQEGFDNWPTWSPDSSRIAFVNGRGSHVGPVKLIRASDGKSLGPARQTIAKQKLAFSPDGEKLLGLFHQQGGRFALCWLDVKSGKLGEELYKDVRGLQYGLSHDGRSIALITTQDVPTEQGGNNGPQCDLWIMPAAGGPAKKLVRFPGRVYDVCWSADGRSLIVVTNLGGAHNDLWQVPLDDPIRAARKLTFGQADEDTPSCDAGGRWMVYTDNRRGATALIVRDLARGRDAPIAISERDFGAPTGELSVEIRDATTDKPTTARVSIRDELGKYHAPPNAIYRMLVIGADLHFYCQGKTHLALPAGKYQITVSRGPEYKITRKKITVRPAAKMREQLRIERWTNQRDKGWYSGESHIHANYGYGQWYNSPRTMLAQSAGEDLVVSNLVVANSEADGVFDREFFRGGPDPISSADTILYWNQEFRSTIWGHLTLLNLKQLVEPIFTGFAHTTHPHDHPTNADIADHTHDQNGHVNYTHPAHNVKDPYLGAYSAKALPLDVALRKVDSIDVMGSNHEANMAVWYRLLNCGFRVPASAGTDCFLNRVRSRLPGQVRVYCHVDGAFTYQEWIKSLRAGRTFVTDGPMLAFTIDGNMAGSTIELKQPGAVRVRGHITSQRPLNRVEVISNGEVVHTVALSEPSLDVAIDQQIQIKRCGWVALRASGPRHPDQPTGSVFGHTSAVYVNVPGHPADVKADAQYFIRWIDRLRSDIRKRNRIPNRHQVHVESQIAEARQVFNRLLGLP